MSQFNTTADLVAYIKSLEKSIEALQRTKVTHGSGAPLAGFIEPYVDDTNSRVYFYVGGVAKSAALT